MTKIDINHPNILPQHRAIVARIVNSRTGELRASKPSTPKMVKTDRPYTIGGEQFGHEYDYANDKDKEAGIAAYVWRMVAFQVSDNPKHTCMPVLAFCDLPQHYQGEERKSIERMADAIVKAIVDSIPPSEWRGVARWGRAMGMC
jgi:hypothetical protein